MVTYRVREWEEHFENNHTRELKVMAWVPLPNKQDGDGYTELMDHPNGTAHFGVWVACVQVASKCDPRGTLLRDSGKPHDSRSLARMTRISEPLLVEAIERLLSIGWLEAVDESGQPLAETPQEGAVIPQAAATLPQEGALNGKKEGKERNGTEPGAAEPPVELPLALAESQLFRTAWGDWIKYRKSSRKSCRPETLKAQLEHLKTFGPDEAADKIRMSIANGWTGIVFKNGKTNGKQQPRTLDAGQKHDPTASRDPLRGFA